MRIAGTSWSQAYGARTPAAPSPAEDDPQVRRLKQQEAVAALKAAPANSAQAKADYLQRRLLELKQMLLHASPQQAKGLLEELRSIAGDLSSIAKSGGGAGNEQQGGADGAAQAIAAAGAAGGTSSLQGLVSEARQALKEVLAMIKSKLSGAPRKDQEQVESVERKVAELDNALAQPAATPDIYTPVGGFMDLGATSSVPSISITV